MLELKEEYRAYTTAVKKILNEYNAMKEQADQDDDYTVQASDSKDSFIVVNREPNYLRKSTIEYCRKQNLDFILKKLDPNDWLDYSDQIKKKADGVRVKKKRRSRTQRATIAPLTTHYADAQLNVPKDFDFAWPIKRSEFWLSSFFGPRRKPDRSWGFHYGIDMAACRGTPVFAAADGIVIQSHFDAGYGNTILISHNNKYKTRYAHLDKLLVSVGQKVERGMVIGKVGSTGHVRRKKGKDPSHLHFEISAYGKKINPLSFFM